jgi:hypothetical protein
MRKLMMLASVAALATALPNVAAAQGRGHGNGHSARAEQGMRGNARARADVGQRARVRHADRVRVTDRNRNGVADHLERRLVDRNRDGIDDRAQSRFVDRNRDGIDDRAQSRFVDLNRDGIDDRTQSRFVDRNRDGIDDRAQNRYGGASCPPGLANRTPACVPPGQAKRMFREGQRVPTNFNLFTDYNSIPLDLRQRFNIPSGYNYVYRDNSVYVVDPTTRVVRDIIDLIF